MTFFSNFLLLPDEGHLCYLIGGGWWGNGAGCGIGGMEWMGEGMSWCGGGRDRVALFFYAGKDKNSDITHGYSYVAVV